MNDTNDTPAVSYAVGIIHAEEGPLIGLTVLQGSFRFSGTMPADVATKIGAALVDTALSVEFDEERTPQHWRERAHTFRGRPDQDCVLCGHPDRHAIHRQGPQPHGR